MLAEQLAPTRDADAANDLVDLQRELSRCTELQAMRELLARRLGALLPVKDRVSIAFIEPDGQWLRIHRILPFGDPPIGALPRVRVEGTPIGQVARDGVGRIVGDTRTDPNITFGHASHDGIRSTVSTPIRVDGKVVGVMNAGTTAIGGADASTLARLETVAAIVGPMFYAVEQGRSSTMIGASPRFRALIAAARRTAESDADVLITGETGVGKTALARAMHGWSPRAAGPFVTVRLGELSTTVVESARGGTLFLDEIGEAPLAIQTQLLRVFQDRAADVRVIAATTHDLREACRRGEFRADLYYRLSVVPLQLPTLRERGDDLELLVTAILARLGGERRLSPAAWAKLRAYRWPGNIRELESVLRRAVILEEGDELRLVDFKPEVDAALPTASRFETLERLLTLDEQERAYIEHVLAVRGGVIEGAKGAARVLGVPPSTLRSKMQRLGIALRGKGRAS